MSTQARRINLIIISPREELFRVKQEAGPATEAPAKALEELPNSVEQMEDSRSTLKKQKDEPAKIEVVLKKSESRESRSAKYKNFLVMVKRCIINIYQQNGSNYGVEMDRFMQDPSTTNYVEFLELFRNQRNLLFFAILFRTKVLKRQILLSRTSPQNKNECISQIRYLYKALIREFQAIDRLRKTNDAKQSFKLRI